jgi:hypothetical protein
MTARISLGLALVAATLVTASVVGPRRGLPIRRPSARPSISEKESPIESLDRCIQRRLHENPGFGMSRLVDSPIHLHHFEPDSPEESEALAALKESGLAVWLRLSGRRLLEPDLTESFDEKSIHRAIAVTGQELPLDFPRPPDLRRIGGQALAASETTDSASGRIGRWSVEARVVRADRKSCLDCHSRGDETGLSSDDGTVMGPLEIGDALGVVIYVYSRDRGADGPGSSPPSRRESD